MKHPRNYFILVLLAATAIGFTPTVSLFAGDDYCERCNCERESNCEKPRKRCFCCCCLNLAEPPRAMMSFSVPAVPVAQIAAPVPQIQLQLQPQQNSADTFSSAEDERLLKELKSLLAESGGSALAQEKTPKSPEERLDELETQMKDLTKAVNELAGATKIIVDKLNQNN